MALDADDRLYLVGENGVFGPFDSARAVEDGDQLGSTLGLLAPRTIAVDNDGRVIVKENLYRWVNWEITQKTQDYEKMDSRTIHFPVRIPADGEVTVRYTVHYSW